MAVGDNPVIPLFEDGDRPSAAAVSAITNARFVRWATGFQAGPLLDTSTPTAPLTGGNLPQVQQCVAGERCCGVAGWDAPNAGDVLPVIAGSKFVVPMVAGASITAGDEVQSDAAGKPITVASGRPNGNALNSATSGQTVWVQLH